MRGRRDLAGGEDRSIGTGKEPETGRPTAPASDDFLVSAPQLALPKGGGAIRGIGEKFAANPVTGTAGMSVPLVTSPGRSSFGPELALSYDSGTGNSSFGFGWSLSVPFVTRKTDDGLPQYLDEADTESDTFVLSGAEDLVAVYRQNPDGSWVRDAAGRLVIHEDEIDGYWVRRYRPRIEGLFSRIERWTRLGAPDDVHWRTLSRDNILTLYGHGAEARIADPQDPTRIFTWLICESRDDKGNAVLYRYKADDGAGVDLARAHERNRGSPDDPRRSAKRYLKRILYGNRTPLLDAAGARPRFLDAAAIDAQIAAAGWAFEVVLDYGDHDPAAPAPGDDTATDAAGAPLHPWPRRPDAFSSYRSGFEVRTTRLCRRVLMFHHFPGTAGSGVGVDCLVRSTDLTYSDAVDPTDVRNPVHTFLRAVTQTCYRRNAGGGYDQRSLPPLDLDYSQATVQDRVEEPDAESLANLPAGLGDDGGAYQWIDLHGEGVSGVLTEQAGTWFYKRNLSPIPIPGPGGDGNGNGDEVVTARFAPMEAVAALPNVRLGAGAQLTDLGGDGSIDVVVTEGPTPGFYEHDDAEGWGPFRPFAALPVRDLRDRYVRFVDLDGDGHADLLLTEDDALVWHPSRGKDGFGPARRTVLALDEETGPRVVFADVEEAVYLADFSGDGLVDIARVRNGEVCYWPNLGHGRFGAKVTMDNAPRFDHPDRFDHDRVHLADLDGSGTTDLVYVRSDAVRLYFNQSGNAWSQPHTLTGLPHLDDAVDVTVADLLGNGTMCLVWSSPLPHDTRRPVRFVNLMGRDKPHLLVGTANNLGAETRVTYAPSTRFFLQDKRDGRPWRTRLPFPVQVVERVETYDHVSRNRFTTRFAYHHGHFDGVEREFRGFGMVEQWDTEELTAVVGAGGGDGAPLPANLAPESHVPPVHTKSWFHTGVHHGRHQLALQYESEYFREPGLDAAAARALLLADATLPAGLDPDEERQACRALKGTLLRQEVYADDAGPGAPADRAARARTPYTVTEQSAAVRLVQPQGDQRHAVFLPHERETLDYQYDRNPADPRVRHALTLEVDERGTVLKLASVGYGRRTTIRTVDAQGNVGQIPNPGLAGLHPHDRAKQTTTLAVYSENRTTNAVDAVDSHRTPGPAETRTFELTGYTPTGPAGRFEHADLVEPDPGAPGRLRLRFDDEVAYEDAPVAGVRCRRAVECLRILYRADDLAGLLPLGELEALGLPGESYKLAFTAGLLDQVFRRPRPGQPEEELLPDPAAVLGGTTGGRGGYLAGHVLKADGRFPAGNAGGGDDDWWLPAGRSFFSPDPADDAVTELAEARQHFFVPRRYRDPFGNDAVVDYDSDDLLITETRDAAGNRVAVEAHDHRVLQPRLISDANRNRTEVAFDVVGLVVGTAAMGKAPPAPAEGDSLQGFVADLSPAQLDAVFDAADPHAAAPALLQDATTRIVYDLDRFRRTRQAHPEDPTRWQPAGAATLARETHLSAPLPPEGLRIQLTFAYTDGFGREIQRKLPAEPDGANGPPRWVGSGWTVFDNKGQPVRQYEPFFSATPGFEFAVEEGVSPVIFYDPVGRTVATLRPNHTYDKTRFDAWQETTYDVNDTCAARNAETGDPRTDPDIGGFVAAYFASLPAAPPWETWHEQRSGGALGLREQQAATRAAAHADTPVTSHSDALGRPILTVARNRLVCPGHDRDGSEGELRTRVDLDIEGNQLAVRDADAQGGDPLGRIVARYTHDLAGNRIHQRSMEAGAHWMLLDAAGKPFRSWDSRGHELATTYDDLRRPLQQTVRGTTAESDPRTLNATRVVDRIEYGETQAGAEDLNLRTVIFRHFDGAGVLTNAGVDPVTGQTEAFDFKGNLLRSTRRLLVDYTALADWSQNPAPALSAEAFVQSTTYDALDRQIQEVVPHSDQPGTGHNVIQVGFNEANLLERVHVWLDRAAEPAGLLDPAVEAPAAVGVSGIAYDAKGQRTRIDYPNGTSTLYEYDPFTVRLTHLETRRGAAPGDVQNLHYTYDPAGNITHMEDQAQQTVFFRNRRVEPSNDYVYDALYRLAQATGREHLGQMPDGSPRPPRTPGAGNGFHTRIDHPGDGDALGTYVERYVYDDAGNLLALQHRGSDPAHAGWTRGYDYQETSSVEDGGGGSPAKTSNRLTRTNVNPNGADPPLVEPYEHDVHGNVVRMPHLGGGQPGPNMHWDYKDLLQRVDAGGAGAGGVAFSVYDSAGDRVRKVWEKAPGLVEERIYLDGYELFRSHNGPIGPASATLERETVHVADDSRIFARVEQRTLDVAGTDPAPALLVRYQFANHLGSVSLELDDQAQIISYEEYSPHGDTTYQAVRSQTETAKRYRYTDKERDEESGFYWFGGRSYAPWLGRWVSCDPAEFVDGLNLYLHVANNPVRFADPTGFGPDEQRLGKRMEKASKEHQDAANKRRKSKNLKPVKVRRQKGVGGKRDTIPDEVKETPGGSKRVVDTKARHIDSQRNQLPSARRADIEANLDQVKRQLVELEKAGEIGPNTKGAALRVIHDSDRGKSATGALDAWRQEANQVRKQWIDAATDPAEKALRERVFVTTTTRDKYSKATKALKAKTPKVKGPKVKGGGLVGKAINVGIAAYILFESGDAWAAAQTLNPISNTTDAIFGDNVTVLGVAEGVLKDVYSFTPLATIQWVMFDLLGPQGDFIYDQKLADRAIREGRNPFCAQCHGPGGALDPNNEWNRRARFRHFEGIEFEPIDEDAIRAWIAQPQ